MTDRDFTLGIEEEYLLVDRETLALAEAPDAFWTACTEELGGQVAPEYLRCQVEVGTKVCRTVGDARDELKRLRSCVAKHAAAFGLAPIASSCHPTADWKNQQHTDKERYHDLSHALGGVARRLLISGMHVHVGIGSEERRIDLMNQFTYFLPHLLALSASSPFWQGEDTGLASYRLTVFDNLPRTGLPPTLSSWSEFERSVAILVKLGLIEDSSKIWWDLRPSSKFPTLETRICDVPSRLEHSVVLAGLTQATMRMLWRLAQRNQRWRIYEAFLVGENRWRAQRFGTTEGLIDFGRGEIVPFAELIDELLALVAEDAAALGSADTLIGVQDILTNGTSADRQRRLYREKTDAGLAPGDALKAVTSHLVEEFSDAL
ncbi:MAG: carboxylate-amine ligase [Pseudomonadota bacterium]